MISQQLGKLLIAQISSELAAHQKYLGISIFFARQSLNGWAKVFRTQSVEEAQHASRIIDFLVDGAVEFDLPALKSMTTHYASALEAVQAGLESEKRVSEQYVRLSSAALEAGDHTSHQFLQWFVDEQVEEERTLQALVDLVASGINLFQAEPLLEGVVASR